ncbi:hypothetical protein [Rufibacter ruber]|uniref:hypothetical protein n=1 Tax=Rufibacter ruber TaxID=1783499 RepID=UPI000833EB48|nr:hypothetical protein [Rufibacter ruber]
MYTHGQRHPETRLYWNEITQKWLKKPVRPTSKGQAVGKAKGQAIGKAVGKTKGSTYQRKLEEIKKETDKWKSFAWLPINLSIETILQKAEELWDDKSKFDIDRALSVASLMIIKRTKDQKKTKWAYQWGYINVHSDDLVKWCGVRYEAYLRFFEKAKFITEYKKGHKGFMSGQYPKQYRWWPLLLKKEGDPRKYHKVEYQTPRLLLKLAEMKLQKKVESLRENTRSAMVQNVFDLVDTIDINQFTSWCVANPKAFKNQDVMNDILVTVNEIKDGNVYINSRDEYGWRFHTPFTNTKKVLRQFVMIGGQSASELDVKNSQFFFMACLTKYPKQCMEILKKSGMKATDLKVVFHNLSYYYETYEDFRSFVDAAEVGEVYQTMTARFASVGKTYPKKKVKDMCFAAFFSERGESVKTKAKLATLYPMVVAACENINGGELPLPMLLQRLESAMMIDRVAVLVNDNATHPFTTVHDSFLAGQEDIEMIEQVIIEEFGKAGLPVPNLDIKK